MPLKWVIDSDAKWKNRRERVMPVADALAEARVEGHFGIYSYETMSLILEAQQDRGDKISTTTLLAECDRNLILERMTDYAGVLDDLWASFRGTMFHAQLERVGAPGAIVEKRYHYRLASGDVVTCKPDILNVELGVLRDYKTVAKLPRFSYPYHHHAEQLKVNRFIIEHAFAIEWEDGNPEPIDEVEERLGVPLRPARWTKLIAEYVHPIDGPKPLVVTKARPDGARGRVSDLGDDAEIGAFIEARFADLRAKFEEWKEHGYVPDIPQGWDALSGWLCVPYCNVRQTCLQLQAERKG